jgi:prepilin-type N-terminal cleavage/methylation domain-containing protein
MKDLELKGDIMKDNRGVTLIELVIAIAILTSIVFAITSFYVSGVKGFARETTTASNQTEVRRLSNQIAREIRRSKEVINYMGTQLVIVDSNNKVVTYYRGANNTFYAGYGEITYDAGTRTIGIDYTLCISEQIKEFDKVINGDQITLTIESIENSEGETYTLVTELNLRK